MIQADRMFSYRLSVPLPKHLLEASYLADKAQFPNLRYWTSEFVGNGPFVVREFEPSTSCLSRPGTTMCSAARKIDEIEVRFIKDTYTVAANVMAGAAELTIGPGLSIEQALNIQANTPGVSVIHSSFFYTQTVAYPQFLNPDLSIQLNLQFRRALAHASIARSWSTRSRPARRDREGDDRADRSGLQSRRATHRRVPLWLPSAPRTALVLATLTSQGDT